MLHDLSYPDTWTTWVGDHLLASQNLLFYAYDHRLASAHNVAVVIETTSAPSTPPSSTRRVELPDGISAHVRLAWSARGKGSIDLLDTIEHASQALLASLHLQAPDRSGVRASITTTLNTKTPHGFATAITLHDVVHLTPLSLDATPPSLHPVAHLCGITAKGFAKNATDALQILHPFLPYSTPPKDTPPPPQPHHLVQWARRMGWPHTPPAPPQTSWRFRLERLPSLWRSHHAPHEAYDMVLCAPDGRTATLLAQHWQDLHPALSSYRSTPIPL